MIQIKVFEDETVVPVTTTAESKANQWLAENPVNIINIYHSVKIYAYSRPSVITIVYKTAEYEPSMKDAVIA